MSLTSAFFNLTGQSIRDLSHSAVEWKLRKCLDGLTAVAIAGDIERAKTLEREEKVSWCHDVYSQTASFSLELENCCETDDILGEEQQTTLHSLCSVHQLKVEAFAIFANFLALFSNEKAVLAETLLVHSIPWLGGGGARLVGCN